MLRPFLASLCALASVSGAQVRHVVRTDSLTIDDAYRLAVANNTAYLKTANTLRASTMQVRTALGGLLPTTGASFSANYQQGGTNIVQGTELKGQDTYTTSYSVNLNYGLGLGSVFAPAAARSARDATAATITAARVALRGQVILGYLNVAQARALAALQDTLVHSAEVQVQLASARQAAGAATILDVRNAEVGLGQARVAAINAHNAERSAIVTLGQLIGASLSPDLKLTSSFEVTDRPPSLDSLLAAARTENQSLIAARASQSAAAASLRIARMQYTPSFSLSSGYGKQAVDHATLPFAYQKRPYSVSAFLSLPVFNGFQRELSMENAAIARDNADLDLHERDMQVQTDVTQAYNATDAAFQAAELQRANAVTAQQVLVFAEERYRLGAASFLDISLARSQYAQAENARVTSIFDYLKAFSTLETAVGRRLR